MMKTQLFWEVHYQVKEGMREEFLQKVKEAGIPEASRQEVGNGRYEFFYPVDQPNELMLLEIWDTEEDHTKHTTMPHFQVLQELKKEYVLDYQAKKTAFEV